MIYSHDCEHLTPRQRTYIRRSPRTNRALAELFGVSVSTIVKVRITADQEHPVRIAARERRLAR